MANVIAGISYPFRKEGPGFPAPATGFEVIRSALTVLLLTPKGSRVMRPDLGTNLQSLIFENTGDLLRAMIYREIATAIASFLPVVQIVTIDINEQDNVVLVNVKYNVQGLADETGSLVFSKVA